MPVKIDGTTFGCSRSLEKLASGIAYAGQDLADLLQNGGSLPKHYWIQGVQFDVVRIAATADGSTNHQTILANALGATKSRPTLLILPPATGTYRYRNILAMAANTYLCGYGATMEPQGDGTSSNEAWHNTAIKPNGSNAGVFGVRMLGHANALSKWPERFETNQGDIPKKDGTYAPGSAFDDAWFNISGSNVIIKDVQGYGSITGFIRCPNTNNLLFENNKIQRTHSDSIHITRNSTNITARNNSIFEAGDDAISCVAYDSTPGPSNILVENNHIHGGRTRGLTVVGGRNVLHQNNIVKRTILAPFLYAASDSHSTPSVIGCICRDNLIYRGGRLKANHSHNGVAVASFSYSGRRVEVDITNNKASTLGEWYSAGGGGGGAEFVRRGGGTIDITETGNSVTALNANH